MLTARLRTAEGLAEESANGEALNRIWVWLQASIAAHQTVGVETVLSTGKYRELVVQAKARGFEFRLLFVTLRSVEQNIERVRLRVARGGHDVPEDKIRARRSRSFEQLPWFLDQADYALLYDNSGASPLLVGQKARGVIEIDPRAPMEIQAAVESLKD